MIDSEIMLINLLILIHYSILSIFKSTDSVCVQLNYFVFHLKLSK